MLVINFVHSYYSSVIVMITSLFQAPVTIPLFVFWFSYLVLCDVVLRFNSLGDLA